MGQDSSKSVREILDSEFKYIKKYSNSCYGELTLVESKRSNKRYALKQIVSDNPAVNDLLTQRKQDNHPSVIKLIEFWVKDQPSLCSSISQIYLLLEYEQTTLQDEIIQRQIKQRHFTANELRKIIQTSVFALQKLSKSNSSFHIGQENTLITSECDIKVVEPDLISDNSLTSQSQGVKRKYYLCEQPALTEESQEEYTNKEGSKIKASVFYLGVMLLSCCLLDESLEDQIIVNGSYDFEKLKKMSRQASERYQKLGHLIERMVKKNPFKRPTYSDILFQLTPKFQIIRSKEYQCQSCDHRRTNIY